MDGYYVSERSSKHRHNGVDKGLGQTMLSDEVALRRLQYRADFRAHGFLGHATYARGAEFDVFSDGGVRREETRCLTPRAEGSSLRVLTGIY